MRFVLNQKISDEIKMENKPVARIAVLGVESVARCFKTLAGEPIKTLLQEEGFNLDGVDINHYSVHLCVPNDLPLVGPHGYSGGIQINSERHIFYPAFGFINQDNATDMIVGHIKAYCRGKDFNLEVIFEPPYFAVTYDRGLPMVKRSFELMMGDCEAIVLSRKRGKR